MTSEARPLARFRSGGAGTAQKSATPTPGLGSEPEAPPRSIRTTIDLIIRSALVSLVLLTAAGLGAVSVLTVVLVQLTAQVTPAERANTAVRQRMTDSESSLRAYQLTRDPLFLQTWQNARQPLQQSLADLQDAVGDQSGIGDLVGRQQRLVDHWQHYTDPIARDPTVLRDLQSQSVAKSYFDAFRNGNSQVATWLTNDRVTLTEAAFTVAAVAAVVFALAAVLGATRGLRPARSARAGVAPPLEDLYRVVTRLHDGDRSARADPGAGVLEIRAVAAAVNDLAGAQQRSLERASEALRLTAFERDWAIGLRSLTALADVLVERLPALAEAMGASTVLVRTVDADDQDLLVVHPPIADERRAPSALVRSVLEVAQISWRLQQPLTFSAAGTRPDVAGAAERQLVTTDRLVPVSLQRRMMEYVGSFGADSMLFTAFGAGDRSLGYLALMRPPGAPAWSDPELDATQRMARDIGRAVALAKSYRREQRLVADLQALDTQKNAFVSMVSHELRTPLASISGHLEIVRAGDLGVIEPLVDRSLEVIERNARRLTLLIGDLLLLSQIEEGERPLTMVEVDLRPVLKGCVTTLRHQAQRAGVLLDLELPASVPPTVGDPQEIERVFDNLIGNAIKFSPTGSRVRIALTADEAGLVVRVSDHGMGISETDQRALFTRFFRSTNPAALTIPGTGLGLAISKIILERHHGRIAVDSALGRGTTMTVTLPARQERGGAAR